MKKFGAILLMIFSLLFIFPHFLTTDAKASHKTGDEIQTDIFLPTSYLQYYNLDNPFAICHYQDQDEEFVAISQNNSIVIYKNEKFSKIDLPNVGNTPVTTLARYENYLIYLYDTVIWTLDITNFDTVGWAPPTPEPIPTPDETIPVLTSTSSFSIYGNKIVCTTTNNICLYQIEKDSLGIKVTELNKTPQIDVAKLLLLGDNVYYSINGTNGIHVWNGTEKNEFDSEANNVRFLTASNDGNIIYYSSESGIYSINSATKTKTTIKTTSNDGVNDLGAIYKPQGICLIDGKLWIVDNLINAVQEIDLENGNSFTEFAITTNSSAVNRLTDKVKDIVIDKDKIYALDEGRIVVIDNVSSQEQTYTRINLSTAKINAFSVGNGYICYSNDNTVTLCKIKQADDSGIEFTIEDVYSYTLENEDKVADITFSEGSFYFVYNKTYDGTKHPYVCKINLKAEELSIEKVLFEQTQSGTATQIVVDVFGTIYYTTENLTDYEFFSYDGNAVNLIAEKTKTSQMLNLQTDFDGKLYALYENNAVDVIEQGLITSKTLETSSNLGAINPAKSMCLSCNSTSAYFIFEGLILCSSSPEELNISTPYSIDIPADFSLDYNPNQSYAKLKQGAKLFKVNASNLLGEHFEFLGYSDVKSSDDDYAIIPLNNKFSLVIKSNVVAVARNSDILTPLTHASELQSSMYAIVDFNVYSIPVLSNEFKISSTFTYGQEISIIGTLTFNQTPFYIVTNGEVTGYIPQSFLTESIVIENGTTEISDVYVYKKGGITVYDSEGNAIGTISKKTKVTVLKRGNTLTIVYGDDIGFIDSDCIVSSSSADILKAVAVILASFSALVTLLFFEFKYLFRKN